MTRDLTRDRLLGINMLLALSLSRSALQAQSVAPSMPQAAAPPTADAQATNTRIEVMSKLLLDTQHQLEETQRQLNEMRSELNLLRAQQASAAAAPPTAAPSAVAEQVNRQQEEQEVLQAEVKQHNQTKVESVSKYPVRVYGLVLFNTFSNAGLVDEPDLPSMALPRPPGQSHGSIGASFRQTVLGVTANGPQLFGARTSADLSIDFFESPSYSYYGSTNGSVRLRRGDIGLAWGSVANTEQSRNEVHMGVDAPLISPLSPTSYATVAVPALAWSGNLWTWSPELRYKHTFSLSPANSSRTLQLEGGLWDPPLVGTTDDTSARVLSTGELSRRPGYLGRASFHSGTAEHAFSFGIGGYSDRQNFYDSQKIQMWAVTGDWQIPLSRRFQLEGEIYRGRGLGGLGGGSYKDVITGTDRSTGLNRTLGLNAVGGWTQLKTQLFQGTEANFAYGQDSGFASDFRQLNLSSSSYVLEQSARTQMVIGNIVYRPRTYLILSPEYRRILSWQSYGAPASVNIYTLSLGYQF